MSSIKKIVNNIISLNEAVDNQNYKIPGLTDLGNQIYYFQQNVLKRPLTGIEQWLILKDLGKLKPSIKIFNHKSKNYLSQIKQVKVIDIPTAKIQSIEPKIEDDKEKMPIAASYNPGNNYINEANIEPGDPTGRTPVLSFEETMKFLADTYDSPHDVPFIWGAPGIGKTAMVNQIGKKNMVDVIILVVSQIGPEDIIGLPQEAWKEVTGIVYVGGNKDASVSAYDYDEKDFAKITKVVKSGQTFRPPVFLSQVEGEGGFLGSILFFDELNTAAPDVLAQCLTLFTGRHTAGYYRPKKNEKVFVLQNGERIYTDTVGYKFPEFTRIWCAGNRTEEGGKLVQSLSAPIRRRLKQVTMVASADAWVKYYSKEEAKELQDVWTASDEGKKTFKHQGKIDPSKLNPAYKMLKIKDDETGEDKDIVVPKSVPAHRTDVLSFIKDRGNKGLAGITSGDYEAELGSFPNPDGWSRVMRTLNKLEQKYGEGKVPQRELMTHVHSHVGAAAALDFVTFKLLFNLYPKKEIENIYKNAKKAIFPPLKNQKFEEEDAIVEKLSSDLLVQTASSQDSNDEGAKDVRVNVEEFKKQLAQRNVFVKTSDYKDLGVPEGRNPEYRMDIVFAIINDLAGRLEGKMNMEYYANIMEYALKVNNPQVAIPLLYEMTKRNKVWAEKNYEAREPYLHKLMEVYPELEFKGSKEEIDVIKSDPNEEDKKESYIPKTQLQETRQFIKIMKRLKF